MDHMAHIIICKKSEMRHAMKQWMESRNYFTLIELLIVVAVITILAGLLLPALKNAREKARTIQCLNQVKTLSSLFLLYADDYNGYLPSQANTGSAITRDGTDKTPRDSGYWQSVIAQLYLQKPSMLKAKVGLCPSGPKNNPVGTTYGGNQYIASGISNSWVVRPPGRTGTFKKPSMTAILIENEGNNGNFHCMAYKGGSSYAESMAASFRHNNFCNVGMLDGHTASLGKKYVPSVVSYPQGTFQLLMNTCFNLGEVIPGVPSINMTL